MEGQKQTSLPICPAEKANFISYIVFGWVLPIFYKGYKKELGPEDMYQPLKAHKSDKLGNRLCHAWENEVANKRVKGKQPSLMRAMIKVFGWNIAMLGLILLVLELAFKVTQPIFLGALVAYYSKQNGNINDAYLYAAAIVLCSAISVLFMHSYMLSQLHLGMKLRVAACSMIYRKSLRLSKTALGDTTAGQVVNLLSNDVGRLDLAVLFVHYLWIGPLETIIVTYLMYREIGISAVFGVIFLLLFIPLQAYLGKKTSVLRLQTALRTDERVRLMNEIIQGIQVIKMYTWEKPFAKLVAIARKKEIKVIRYVSYIKGILLSFIMFTTRVSIFISLIAYALLGNFVTAEKAFVITAYYNILRATMTIFFPQGIAQFAEAIVSILRIQKFMSYDEVEAALGVSMTDPEKDTDDSSLQNSSMDWSNGIDKKNNTDAKKMETGRLNEHLSEAGVIVDSATARWDPKATEYTLEGVNLHVQPGTLVAVIGPVGAGKSSLMHAILGELPLEGGSIKVSGEISYASQEPWLFSASVRQNILFGLPMDKDRYKRVVKTCALERDFQLFANGDKTIVGERGVSLSGGQKARISLARAVYRNAEVYLLDDPLSAVDAHVGRHLFDYCMREYLKGKIVILVTHQLQYLQSADQIVILKHGKVEAVGTYDSLRETGLDFAQLLSAPSGREDEDSTDNESLKRAGSLYKRQSSESSVDSSTVDGENSAPQMEQEKRQEGSIGYGVYKAYCKASGGYAMVFFLLVTFILSQLSASGGDYFLTYWVSKEESRISTALVDVNNNTDVKIESESELNKSTGFFAELFQTFRQFTGSGDDDRYIDIYIFTGLTVATIVITLSRSMLFFRTAMRASRKLHDAMFNGVTRATMYFFNTNPSGRILNRFSKDMGQIDEYLPSVTVDVIQIFLSLLGIVVVVAIVNPYNLIPTVVIGIIFYFLRELYLLTSRNVKRVEATTRSPIYSHLSASLSGLSTIRAFGAEKVLVREFDNHQDLHSSSFYLFISTSRAFGFYLDVFCVIYIAIVTLTFFINGDSGGNVGLAITQALGMTGMVQWGMRQSAELENTMTSVERVVEYDTVDPEPALEAEGDKKPPKEWPQEGRVKFEKLSLRYHPDPDTDCVLKELEFEIQPREKVGIVGRTGAGKSSLISALFRLSYNEGSIVIDTRDIHEMGLHDLRGKLSIIPQEPVLFSGTLRYNLDPFDEYADDKLWRALKEVKLEDAVNELPSGLSSKINEGGSNFSVGQRQLVCLARAILRENKILVMDEATANVDPQTDKLIQATIREKFNDCTVLTIAHRLNTVMDSDKVLVMDAGRCVEFGTPYELLTTKDQPRIFYGMVKQVGKSAFENLLKIAKEAHKRKHERMNDGAAM
ncbi:probable multidrug resistance-associated protein lethal(2)03659 [Topomyia yanbarensis]|uniref:probable multidrug resistance-associated protein lethal(2)03659 n=1 Tax=Topomyia yanbarensis TaxID=2498891 RepID=UPI00273AD305|nr:probable multidrug resistance-associated protein lethal(2)03659 [Topomyia yanbarensis]XP_058838491.1 probable multidrug resistance-associated protein lethal(2)03659 [Topomyia yanbarensis]XP_058838492.1 probable multidrug resistance-associated protein lethal(2)03659 [Topomyia yanbarensis]